MEGQASVDSSYKAYPDVVVVAKNADPSKFEILLEDGTVIFSGSETYARTKNLMTKYPLGKDVVEMLRPHLSKE